MESRLRHLFSGRLGLSGKRSHLDPHRPSYRDHNALGVGEGYIRWRNDRRILPKRLRPVLPLPNPDRELHHEPHHVGGGDGDQGRSVLDPARPSYVLLSVHISAQPVLAHYSNKPLRALFLGSPLAIPRISYRRTCVSWMGVLGFVCDGALRQLHVRDDDVDDRPLYAGDDVDFRALLRAHALSVRSIVPGFPFAWMGQHYRKVVSVLLHNGRTD